MSHTIEGKVAKILSERHLVVNLGAMHGVKPGVVFAILAEGDEVKDPDTSEVLGRWEMPKGQVVVTNSQERLSTCEACGPGAEKDDVDPRTRVLSADMTDLAMRPENVSGRKSKLNVNRRDVSGMPQIGPISVGDKVRASVDLDDLK